MDDATHRSGDGAHLLMLRGVAAACPDCGDERILLPVEHGAFCCTSCDAAVFLLGADRWVDPLTGRLAG